MDSRNNRNRSSSQDHHRNPNPDQNPNPNPNPAATIMGGSSTSTSQSTPNRLTIGALSLPNLNQPPRTHQLQQQQMVQRTPDSVGFGFRRGIDPSLMLRRRGRPRKNRGYDNVASSSHGGGGNANSSYPPGNNQQPEAIEASAGIGFIHHIVEVKRGEDIGAKLIEFSEQAAPRTVCIMSATGTVGRVTLRHSYGLMGIITYEGRYEIVTLSGSIVSCEVNGRMSRIGSLNVALAVNDGRVIGGAVISPLVAATDVQVFVVSFFVAPKL